MKKVEITINNKKFKVNDGKTIFEACKENGIYIPTLCYHPDLNVKANCRVCVVETEGQKDFSTACSTRVLDRMKIATDSIGVKKARKINLELLFSQHNEECFDCVWNLDCDLLKLARENKVAINRFNDRKTNYPIYQFGNAIQFDSSKCIDCRNCVETCHSQGVDFLELKEKNNFFQVIPSKKWDKDCIYCGQCITHCPAGAFEAVGEFEDIEKPLKEKGKKVIFQFAPAIRSEAPTDKVVAAIKKLGAYKAFDTCVGADFTTFSEAEEVMERIKKNKNLPIFSSCCPSWVRYVELHYPEYIKNLSTTKSPQVILGGLIKTYWAKKKLIDPRKIFVVSIMPCTAKKYEISRSQLRINGLKPVDCVLTTREFLRLTKKHNINFSELESQKADEIFGDPSGAGIIYGATGGVVESVFRMVFEKLTRKVLENVNFNQARGMQGVKEVEIKIGPGIKKIAIINGLGNAKKFLNDLRSGKRSGYACVEVMACPGGCIGGGGQPMPTSGEIRKKRAEILYLSDENKKIRKAQDNPIVKEVYKEFINKNKHLGHKVLHTHYNRQFKNNIWKK